MFRTLLLFVCVSLMQPLVAQISFTGAGVLLESELNDNYPVIKQVLKFSPAADAGIYAGETLWSVDGKSTQGVSAKDATQMIKGTDGVTRTLVVGNDQRSVSLTLRLIKGNCTDGDCLNGEGRIEEPTGDFYVGNFTNGKFDGYGMYYYYKGEHMYARYDGHFVAGKRDGDAVLDNYDGGYQYRGTFKADKASGKAKLTFYSSAGTYEGNFADDKPTGSGILTYPDGTTKTISPATFSEILAELGLSQNNTADQHTDNHNNSGNTNSNSTANTNEAQGSSFDFTSLTANMLKVENSLSYMLDKYADFKDEFAVALRNNDAATAESNTAGTLQDCIDYFMEAYDRVQLISNADYGGAEITQSEYQHLQDWGQAIGKIMNPFNSGMDETATVSTWYWLNVNVDYCRNYLEEAAAARHALF